MLMFGWGLALLPFVGEVFMDVGLASVCGGGFSWWVWG